MSSATPPPQIPNAGRGGNVSSRMVLKNREKESQRASSWVKMKSPSVLHLLRLHTRC